MYLTDQTRSNRFRLPGLTVMIFGAIALLALAAGSAVGIGYALKGPATSASGSTTTTVPDPATVPSTTATSSTLPTDPSGTTPSTVAAPTASTPPIPSQTPGPAPGMQSGPPGNLVTQAVAQQVLATTWTGFAQAMVSDDRGSLSEYTTPSALEDSTATLDCGCLPGPLTYSTTAISTPPQSSYPLSFMAGLNGLGYNQVSQTWWVVFTKASATTPWLIAFFASYAEGDGLEGFTSNSVSSLVPVQFPLAAAPQSFVDYFQTLDSTGNVGTGAPTGYAKNNFLTTEVTNTAALDARQKAAGLTQTFTHSVDQVSPVFAQVINGVNYGDMECFAMHMTVDTTSSNGSAIVQPANQSVWGYEIPPGSYSSLSFTQEDDECVEESATSGITQTSDSGGRYQIATIPSG